MPLPRRLVSWTLVVALPCLLAAAPQDQTATVRSSVDLVAVDVQVVDRNGDPIAGLAPADFAVWINGKVRRVLSADLVKYSHTTTTGSEGPASLASSDATTARASATDRVYVLAIDEASFLTDGIKPALKAARRFVQHLQPDDLVGLYVYPSTRPALELTHGRAAVGFALDRIAGGRIRVRADFHLSTSEIIDITANDSGALARVAARECRAAGVATPVCLNLIKEEANTLAGYFEAVAAQSMSSLRHLFQGLGKLPGRKTVVLVSGGLASSDRLGGRPNLIALTEGSGADAAVASANLYIIHIDESFAEAFSSSAAPLRLNSHDRALSSMRDGNALTLGLERIASAAGGQLLRIQGGTADRAFDRVLRETTAYYLLGVETVESDRDDQPHFIRVKTQAHGAALQHRTHVLIPKSR